MLTKNDRNACSRNSICIFVPTFNYTVMNNDLQSFLSIFNRKEVNVNMEEKEILNVVEFFGGIGAIRKALERVGIQFKVLDYVEIDEYAVKSYNAMFNETFEAQDICNWNKDLPVDLIMHGSPCQDFSIAGLQRGGDEGSGTRSSLMYETIRIVNKLKPKYVIWENVKNILSKKHIHNFNNYLNIMNDAGYNNYYQVLNSKDYGVPQNRERVFTVSIREDIDDGRFKFPDKEPLVLKLKDYLEEEYDADKVVLTEKQMQNVKGVGNPEYSFGGKVIDGDIYNTITASYGKNSGNSGKIKCKEGYRILTAKECWRLMGFDDDDYNKAASVNSKSQLYKQARKLNCCYCFGKNYI